MLYAFSIVYIYTQPHSHTTLHICDIYNDISTIATIIHNNYSKEWNCVEGMGLCIRNETVYKYNDCKEWDCVHNIAGNGTMYTLA